MGNDLTIGFGILDDIQLQQLDVDVSRNDDIGGVVASVVVGRGMYESGDIGVEGRTRRQGVSEGVVAGGESRQRERLVVDLAPYLRGVAVNEEAHLEVVGATSATVLDDQGDTDIGAVGGGVDNDRGSGYVEDRVDTIYTLGDGVIVDIIILRALDDADNVEDTQRGTEALMEGVVEVLHR